jgi:membrane associated rhomboid family serine protease
MFLHGSWIHLLGNMLFLWVFGDNIEDAMGHVRFIMFYLMCGIFAAVLHSWMNPTSDLPLIGASGAVAGVIAAYIILHPKVKVWVLALWRIPIRITAAWALGIWIAAQFGNLLFQSEESVAWWAHIGGLLAGATLILFMRRRGVVLFDKTRGGA